MITAATMYAYVCRKDISLKFICLSFIVLLLSGSAQAQFALIADKDGYCNVRASAQKSAITDKLNNGQLVYCGQPEGSWIPIDYQKRGGERSGYVFNDRVNFVSNYLSIPVIVQQADKVVLQGKVISIVLAKQPFDRTKNKLNYHKRHKDQLERINGKPYWGTDSGIPRTEYASMTVSIGTRKIMVPRQAFENLFEPNLQQTSANYDQQHDILYIYAMNSDGAGAYQVIWKIVKGAYKERLVVYGF